jgi:N-carbamoylputrescine amidase
MNVKVATVQMESRNGDYDGNRSRAEQHIIAAVKRGARLIALPEFALAGYIFTDRIWEMAEPARGRTYRWMKSLSEKHNVYIGTCILEQDGDDFYDAFILTGPGKDEMWSHRKIEPAGYESYFFRGGGINLSVFQTPLGRIGVVICFDSSKSHTVSNLLRGGPDLVLMVFSCPGLPAIFTKKDRNNWIEVTREAPVRYAAILGVPVISSNKCGGFSSPLPGLPGLTGNAEFVNIAMIVDPQKNKITDIFKNEGVLVEEVLAGGGRTPEAETVPVGRWFLPYSLKIKTAMEVSLLQGMVRYRLSGKRKKAASRAGSESR